MEVLLSIVLMLALAALFFGMAGLASAWALLRGLPPRSVVMSGFLTMMILVTTLYIIGRSDTQQNPMASFQQYFTTEHFEAEWKADFQPALKMNMDKEKLDAFKENYRIFIYNLLPAWLSAGCLIFGLLAYYLVSLLLSHVTTSIPKAMAFREWVIPEPMVFGLILAGIFKLMAKGNGWLDLLGNNLLCFFSAVYVLGGFSIVSFFLHKWRLPTTMRILSYLILILVQLSLETLCVFGVLDIWFDFRKIKSPRTETVS